MTTFFITLVALLIVVGAMSIGVLLGRKPMTGSCGGMNQLGMKTECDVCGGKPADCDKVKEAQNQAGVELAYEASRSETR